VRSIAKIGILICLMQSHVLQPHHRAFKLIIWLSHSFHSLCLIFSGFSIFPQDKVQIPQCDLKRAFLAWLLLTYQSVLTNSSLLYSTHDDFATNTWKCQDSSYLQILPGDTFLTQSLPSFPWPNYCFILIQMHLQNLAQTHLLLDVFEAQKYSNSCSLLPFLSSCCHTFTCVVIHNTPNSSFSLPLDWGSKEQILCHIYCSNPSTY
jgi:hypothetical protein